MYCSSCGKEVTNDATVCVICGQNIQKLTRPVTQSVSVSQQGWSDSAITFLLFSTAIIPLIGLVAGIIALFKNATVKYGRAFIVISLAYAVMFMVSTPIGGIIFGLIFSSIIFFTGRGKQKGIYSWKVIDVSSITKKCPHCAEQIQIDALVCRYCGHKFEEADVVAAKQLLNNQTALSEVQAKETSFRRRWKILKFFGWWLAVGSGLLFIVVPLAYFFPTSDQVQKSTQMPIGGMIAGIIMFGLLLLLAIWMIHKANKLSRIRHSN